MPQFDMMIISTAAAHHHADGVVVRGGKCGRLTTERNPHHLH